MLGTYVGDLWLRTYVGDSVGYMPPSQSFLLTPAFGNLLKDICELIDIPLVDQQFYDNKIIDYKEELITIGVMSEFGEACKFIGRHLMSLAANVNLTRANVYSILNFIRFLREKLLPPEDFIKSIKEGKWLRTLHGEQCPVHSILFDSEWTSAARISNLPFIDEEVQIRANIVFATYFSQVLSHRNKSNRAAQRAQHATGRISFPQLREKINREQDAPPTQGDFFKATHISRKTNEPIDELSRHYI
ncbi:ATP/DNA binding protein, partial [Thalictrum thalictroides]